MAVEERRSFRRHWAAIPVVVRYRDACIEGVSINLSEGGMYLFAAAHLPIGSPIELEYRPQNAKQLVSVSATVRRRALYLYGVEFQRDDVCSSVENGVSNADRALNNGKS